MNAVLSTPQTECITLYYREGSSDKVYQAAIEPQGEGFVVNIAYGRRGSTMSSGTKTQIPVEINNQYAYLMGEDYQIGNAIYDAGHTVEFTLFYYEQLRAVKLAADRAKLSSAEVENIFFGNAFRLFSQIAAKLKYI